jgi:hypothetical protein
MTSAEVTQFADLWLLLNNTHVTAQPDTIAWKLMANGSYSANSAYNIQFQAPLDGKVEEKCKNFG